MRKINIALIVIILASVLCYGVYYVNDYYRADETAIGCLNGTYNVSVIETSNGLFLDGPGNDSAVIFYPGAKVEYTSYLPLLTDLTKRGVDCYLVKMPFNIAFFGEDTADEIINAGNYTHYYLAGHSLGGVVASDYVNKTNRSDGLILISAYPTSKISKPVLSIYGSEDKVLDLDKYSESKELIKSNFTEFVINGANHAQFGNYGNQSGDGIAKISAKDQQNQSANKIFEFVNYN